MKTVTEKYRAIKSGQISETEFVRQMRLAHPQHITQFNGFADTVQILKNKGLLFEEKEYVTINISDDSVRRGIRYELTSMGIDPSGKVTSEDLAKAKKKATDNVAKDPLHYYNLLSGESSKVDKHDKYQEVKKNNQKDTFNDMKKADLKEDVEKELGASDGEISDLVKNEKHIKNKLDKAGKKYSKSYSKDKHGQKIVVFKLKENLNEGTRALIGYVSGDRLTTTYNHYDGYPSNLGKGLMTHYNDDEKAKEIAMKGYITGMDPDTGDISATHSDPPTKIKLPEDGEEMAREVAEEIDGMGADYGYIWHDESNQWLTIKNTGIRSMIDQITGKMGVEPEVEEDIIPAEEAVVEPKSLREETMDLIAFLKKEKGADNETIKDFIKTHFNDIRGASLEDISDEFDNYISVNTDYVDEKRIRVRKEDLDADFAPSPNSDVMDANAEEYDVATAFKKAGVDMSKPVTVIHSYGHAQYASSDKDEMSAQAAIKKLEAERQDRSKQYTDDGMEVPEDHHGYEFENYSTLEEEMPEGHEYKLAYFQTGDNDYAITQEKSGVSEKKGKDHDGDGDIDGDDYMAAKDKAIKKAMGKDEQLKEAVKNIITRTLSDSTINEAATNDLAKIAEDYGDFEGLKPAIIALQNIVTEIESFYDKTRGKIQKIYTDLGEVRNEEGLKVGAFIAPSIENAFKRDLRPITKQQFHGGLDMPKVKRISETEVEKPYTQMEAPKETVFTPVNEKN